MKDTELLNIIKSDMGLTGKGVSAGKKTFKKGGFGFKDLLKPLALAAKVVFPPAAIPLKMVGLGNGEDILDLPMKLVGQGKNGYLIELLPEDIERGIGRGMSAGGMSAGNMYGCPHCGMTGGNMSNLLRDLQKGESLPKLISKYSLKKGKGISAAGMSAAGMSAAGMSAGAELGGMGMGLRPTRDNMPASMMGAAKKRGRPSKKVGGDILSTLARVANIIKGGKKKVFKMDENVSVAKVSKAKAPKGGKVKSGKLANRAALVKKIMKEKGLKMIEASKYIRENNLTY
jgi:hypothetical protein